MNSVIYNAVELFVRFWVTLYLVGVPREARAQRRAEIASDLYECRRDAREQGRSQAAAALLLLVRCVAGVFDDLSWRSEAGVAMGGTGMSRNMRTPVLRVALATALILMAPLVAMQFSDDVVWTPFDFILMGVLLFSTGMAYELVAKRVGNMAYRGAFAMALVSAFLLFWVNGAVGIIGSEDNPANLMYFGVLAIGVGGTLIARFQARGMALTLFAAAVAQSLVAVTALIMVSIDPSWWGEADRTNDLSPVFQLLGVNGMFIVLFLASARLFQIAASGKPHTGAGPGVHQHAGR